MCVHDKLKKHSNDLLASNGHSIHRPAREDDIDYLAYIGNGHFGLAFDSHAGDLSGSLPDESLTIRIRGQRTLSVAASYKPIVEVMDSQTN